MARADLHARLSYALAWIRGRTDVAPRAGVVLGSGLGGFADRLRNATVIPYGQIPEFPTSHVMGHAGRLVVGELPGEPGAPAEKPLHVAVLQGACTATRAGAARTWRSARACSARWACGC